MTRAAEQLDLALWQEHLDGRLPGRPMLHPHEVAKFLGTDKKTVARIFSKEVADATPLYGLTINGGRDKREHRRIMRDGVILYWAKNANYTPEEFRAQIVDVLGNCSTSDLAVIQAAIGELIRRKQS